MKKFFQQKLEKNNKTLQEQVAAKLLKNNQAIPAGAVNQLKDIQAKVFLSRCQRGQAADIALLDNILNLSEKVCQQEVAVASLARAGFIKR